MRNHHTTFLCVVTGISCFFLGAILQQHVSIRNIKNIMNVDPYIFNCRRKLLFALALLGEKRKTGVSFTPIEPQCKDVDSVLGCTLFWFRLQCYKVFSFFFLNIKADEEQPKLSSSHLADIMKYGFPGLDDIRVYKSFVLSYDRRHRIAHWVCEHLRAECITTPLASDAPTKPSRGDQSIPVMFRATTQDYKYSDFVEGHLAAPNNYSCDTVQYNESFLLSNIVPQNRIMKNYVWQRLEEYVRQLTLKSGSVYVYSGPLYMPHRINFRNWAVRFTVIGMNTVAVPTHFFKVIISEHKNPGALPYMEGYVVPNAAVDKEIDLRSFLSDIRDIEHFAGLKFYEGVRRSMFNRP
ncbi:endonuclease G, mitochondrial [Scaptodrosophila lebanonensis]|uniref:Endonuclease G, mitochondrial n=1 Tax=Drosophila lebanonensis TaxID=7225 RepID=A0A6J2SZ25_DROLE|nr:endonuclease G, mitochondrial [Scaptodrosophila lebanonensis]